MLPPINCKAAVGTGQQQLPTHLLPPVGCRAAAGAHAAAAPTWLVPGCLMLSPMAHAAASGVWSGAGAVLNMGDRQHASFEAEPACEWAVSIAEPNGSAHIQRGVASSVSDGAASCSCVKVLPMARLVGPLRRYLWLPGNRGLQRDRLTLRRRLPAALAFIAQHLAQHSAVLVVCDDGLDCSVCVALAAMLAMPHALARALEVRSSSSGGGGSGGASAGSVRSVQTHLDQARQGLAAEKGAAPPASVASGVAGAVEARMLADGAGAQPGSLGQTLSKQRVRQQLAAISAAYPAARPTRENLKHVFNQLRCLECGCVNAR